MAKKKKKKKGNEVKKEEWYLPPIPSVKEIKTKKEAYRLREIADKGMLHSKEGTKSYKHYEEMDFIGVAALNLLEAKTKRILSRAVVILSSIILAGAISYFFL